MMRKIKYIVIVLSGILAINSCDTKDLELTNPNELSPETFFKTEAQVEASVNAVYANLQVNGLYGRHIFFALDNMSGENVGNSGLEGNKSPFLNFTFDASSDIIQLYWEACFLGIAKANFVLDNADKINALSVLSQEKKNKYLAEAHFMRAYYYFLLVPRFGDLPIYTTQSITGAARSPKEEVYKLITDDFDFASKNLLSTDQKGRPDKTAAFAYLGKALLYQKKYDEALAALNNVKGKSLEPNFFDNFREENEHGIESIFEIEFDAKLGSADRWSGSNGSGGEGLNEATLRSQEYGPKNAIDGIDKGPEIGGWLNVAPSDDMFKAYEAGDKRYDATFYVAGSKYNEGKNTMVETNFPSGYAPPVAPVNRKGCWKKYSLLYKTNKENTDSGINFRVMRYSDVVLMKAECENQRAGGSQANAIAYIKEVRDRAGLTTVISATKDAVFTAIVHERMVEFAAEQIRFDDLVRWNLAGTVLGKNGFKVGKNELWPIPNRETSSNPNIKPSNNNPQW